MDPIPYSRQEISDADIAAVVEVLKAPFLTQGPAVERFEADFAALHKGRHAVAVCNATAALHLACLALRVGPGDLVWTSPISFVASANCALYCGADIGFVDIDPVTRNMSVPALAARLEEAEKAGRLPKVVVPVDFSGLPCDLEEMRALADRYGFKIVSDSSHAVGATYRGELIGRYADISVFSFHPVKIVTTGEGGLCLTDDAALADRLRLLRSHGITRDAAAMQGANEGAWYYEQIDLGFNYRITDIQAALGSSQLTDLDDKFRRRDAAARRYDDLLATLPVKLPARLNDRQSAHHLYVVEVENGLSRKAVFDALRADGILVNVHYIPIHLQPYYRALGFAPGDFPASEAFYEGAVTLPLFPSLSEAQQDHVAERLSRALGS
ncbi:UDP-4-amino-4,6-dideoxy-N-acetyl-beta-L-altrosamine transaminase [Sphingopyxis granuli]|uniref:UDP-4-amino-4, 6-dideoxy-N-acetyl-beta-L-altrosamine transaminase n=1 Tax=Sphingopyxis granuli TaxID=267128 RepID=UPI001BB079CD|nr:UDP-4-amino-4,6-dideoxy-N-acetyl-beta-L-altrosamine transaminase [Sphingopyxis granuli]QUM71310.1 UDP-4-amino-4,6-dideoxy-N-acetyl-beta-L-altrosamine transaminase [Sphingopyxis granuli]